MKRLICLIAALIIWQQFFLHPATPVAEPTPTEGQCLEKILLVPLDSRPPCRDFAVKIGKIAAREVIAPPSEIMDYYSYPGETQKLREWLKQNIKGKQGAILSVDQLLYGGLLAARENEATPADMQGLLKFLRELHETAPAVPLYAFSILPRLTPQDSIDGYYEKKALTEYSRLIGRRGAGLAVDETEIAELRQKISPVNLDKYTAHFEQNRELNQALAKLTQEGVLTGLVLGQDDGEPYSIPNLEKEKLRKFLAREHISSERVFLIHGADEIALLLLAKLSAAGTRLTAHVAYNDPRTPATVMPFMAVNMEEVTAEKLRFLNITPTRHLSEADFALMVSVNDGAAGTLDSRAAVLRRLCEWQRKKVLVALVDLSQHFEQKETLLPLLRRKNFPLNGLAAYAGWNTAGNSVGTAVAQSAIYATSLRRAKTSSAAQRVAAANLTFVHERILEDNFYLKDVIDLVNHRLIKSGYRNTADLDLNRNYLWANRMLRVAMQRRLATYRAAPSFRRPVSVAAPTGDFTLQPLNIVADMSYPWPRTFEINLTAYLNFGVMKEKPKTPWQ